MEFFDYQIEGGRFLARVKRGLLADKPRVGKTGSMIHAADVAGAEDVLEITTGSARRDHAKAWRGFQKIKRKVTPIYSVHDDIPTSGVVITSWSLATGALRQRLQWHGWDAIAPDECKRAKEHDSGRTQALYGEKCDGDGGLVEGVPLVFCLDGTPAPNHYGELWPMMRAVMPETILGVNGKPMSRSTFEAKYCRRKNTPFGLGPIIGNKNAEDLKRRLAPRMLRRSLQDVRPGMPEIVYDTLELDAADNLSELKALERDALMVEFKGRLARAENEDEHDAVLAEIEKAIGPHLRRLTGLAKVAPFAAWLKEQFEDGLDKVVVFAWHHEVIDALAKAFPRKCVVIDGRNSPAQRDERRDAFMKDHKVFGCIGQIIATGEAIDLSAADQVIFIEADWVPGNNDQCAHRVVNVNKSVSTLARFASLPGSIDSDIQSTNARKARDLSRLFS
ncbi:DEAD/DEAH box helicase [Bradyrhizobium stylosanthis]|uniref:Helicase C-terminal domain-containing protein n=1 Tax=Bradyrhizobium stylosanthis TaxID=1803665 RepID=A0A560CXI9_9BRAD|nr:DEAD/DEAH box helicase [Bradyrhizobium stylosanthis]TWA89546.1 hypothetical protein FBZ96_11914 [Bradyrhizobium stylosanthis]